MQHKIDRSLIYSGRNITVFFVAPVTLYCNFRIYIICIEHTTKPRTATHMFLYT